MIEKSEKTDQRVTVIGSGPLGLSCAFYLGCQGYAVSVLDPSGRAGGALAGLSPEKIEPQVLSHEINRLIRLADIRFETGAAIDFETLRELRRRGNWSSLTRPGFPKISALLPLPSPAIPLRMKPSPADHISQTA
jgi:NADPH-dependent glutamate synthase beta subunit-like oxidoreductase